MSVTARANAKKLLIKYCIEKPEEIDLEAILYSENLVLKKEFLETCEGKILFNETMGIITINNCIKDKRQERFITAHEMGHFMNEKALTQPLPKGEEKRLTGRGIYKCGFEQLYGDNKRNREWEANVFASELLMPEEMYQKKVKSKNLEVRMLTETAEYFNVSVCSAAIRYSEIGERETAVIMCKDGVVKWNSIHKDFKYKYISKGTKVRNESYAYDYFIGKDIPENGEDIPASGWFLECYNIDMNERIVEYLIPFPRYNSLLVLLWMR